MSLNKTEILEKVQDYLSVLKNCLNQEEDQQIKQQYVNHIKSAEDLLEKLVSEDNLYNYLPQFFETEGRSFGWSYLPNDNGRKAENAFWELNKEFNLNPNFSKFSKYQLSGMTVNERLVVTGMSKEFDKAKKADKNKAAFILRELQINDGSIELM